MGESPSSFPPPSVPSQRVAHTSPERSRFFYFLNPLSLVHTPLPPSLPVPLPLSSNLPKVREVLEREGDAFACRRDLEGHTFVHWAALGGHNDLITFLLEKGAPLNAHSKNDYGPLPIHFACVHGHIMTIEYFVERGVDINVTDLNGCSPLIVSAQYGESPLY